MKHIVIDARESGTSTGRYIDKLVEYLHQLKPHYKITLLAKKHRLDYLKSIAPGFHVEITSFKEFSFGEQIGLLRQIKRLSPNLVFFPAVQQPILYHGKVVTTIQDLTTVRFRNPGKNWLIFTIKRLVYIWVNKIVGKKSTRLITPSEFVKEDFARFAKVNARNITVTYESADKITDRPQPVDGLENKQFVMYLGRPQPHKNLVRLVEAFVALQIKNPDLYLALVGKKDLLYRRLQLQIKRRGIKNVVFTGFVTEAQLRWLYENTKAYVFPSLSEGFGLPGLEAMAHGAPVASSNATCLPEIYKVGALYFDPLDVDDMTKTIGTILENKKKRQKLVIRGYSVSQSYSWRRMAEQTIGVFEEALED